MGGKTISQLPFGGVISQGDDIPVERGGADYKVNVGTAAAYNVGAFLQTANNLSDLGDSSAARNNLGLGGLDKATTVLAWAIQQNWKSANITRNINGVISSASIVYPDGTPGIFTATAYDGPTGAINSWVATYGSPAQYTFTQPAVTRDLNGAVTVQPAITVS